MNTSSSRRQRFRRNDTGEEIDLADSAFAAGASVDYICENCEGDGDEGVKLVPYPKAQRDNPFAGPYYICPRCKRVYDSSLGKMLREDSAIKPDLEDPSISANDAAMIDTVDEDRSGA